MSMFMLSEWFIIINMNVVVTLTFNIIINDKIL